MTLSTDSRGPQPTAPQMAFGAQCFSFKQRLGFGVVTFFSCLGYSCLWIWQGIDFTDEGFNLIRGKMLIDGAPGRLYDMTWLSDMVCGAWSAATEEAGLLGARAGGAVNVAAIGLASYWILTRHFSPRSAWLATTAAIMMMFYRGVSVITYNTFPALLLILASGTILLSQDERLTLVRRLGWGLLTGVFLALAIAARFPLILAVTLPALPVGTAWLRRNASRQKSSYNALVAVISWLAFLFATAAILAWLNHWGKLSEYWQQLTATPKASHSLERLLSLYTDNAVTGLEHALLLILLGIAAGLSVQAISSKYPIGMRHATALVIYAAILLTASVILNLAKGESQIRAYFGLALPALFCVLGALLAIDMFCMKHECDHQPLMNLLLLALVMPFILTAGSANGLLNMSFGMSLIVPAVILLLPGRVEAIATYWSLHVFKHRLRSYWLVFVAVWVVCGLALQFDQPYRDLGNRLRLIAVPEHPRLRYIHTTPERASSINELLKELDRRVQSGDRILAYDSLPLLHYITDTLPALDAPWPAILDPNDLETRLCVLRSSQELPAVAVQARANMYDPAWGVKEVTKTRDASSLKARSCIDKTLADLGYYEVWHNRDFVILSR